MALLDCITGLGLNGGPSVPLFTQSADIDTGQWTDWQANSTYYPILRAEGGTQLWSDPCVVKIAEGDYHIFVASSTGTPFIAPIAPFHGTSIDGLSWVMETTALLDPSLTVFESIETPNVVLLGATWHMYLTGNYAASSVKAIAHATASSINGPWTYQGIVLEPSGVAGTWNQTLVAEPGACVIDGQVYLYFTAIGIPALKEGIGLAISSDGSTFGAQIEVMPRNETLYPFASGWQGPSTPAPLVHNGDVHLFYDVAFDGGGGWRQILLAHAVSADGQEFTETATPVLDLTDTYWDGEVIGPSPLVEGDRVRLWFGGHVSTAGPQWTEFNDMNWLGSELGVSHTFANISLLPSAVAEEQPSGGWEPWWTYESVRRRRERERLKRLREETEELDEPTTREIAKIERDIESVIQRNEELSRLRKAAETYGKDSALAAYNDRVAAALERAILQGNYSALEALEREMLRAQDEAEFFLLAMTMILSDE
jgi:hypothetical protein